jgi:hypothetical protein
MCHGEVTHKFHAENVTDGLPKSDWPLPLLRPGRVTERELAERLEVSQ